MTYKGWENNFRELINFCEKNRFDLWETLIHGRYGDWSISVTELLSIIVDPWFEFVKANHPQKLKEACDRGTEIHSMLENSDTVEIISTPSKKESAYYKYYKRFLEWKILSWVEILEKEKTFIKDWIRWTIDAITDLWVVDYKSSRRKNIKYFLQVAGYCWLSDNDKWYILYMNEKWFDFDEVEDLEYYKKIFLELLEYSKTILNYNKCSDGNT